MAVKHLTYRDIPADQRQKGAAEARTRIVTLLSNPFLTPEQRAALDEQRTRIDLWEKGALPEARKPTAHVIQVNDTARVGDGLS